MKMWTFSKRTAKEILRDPLHVAFGLGFPLILLFLMSAIQASVPVPLFAIKKLAPGIVVFGLSFMTLFSATLLAKDRESALLQRLYATPLSAGDFILGYMLPTLPIAAVQSLLCCVASMLLGLPATAAIFGVLLFVLPIALLFVSIGLFCGSIWNVKQVGGICGALFTNLAAWFSGTWFDLNLVGGTFQKIAYALPFVHAVELERAVLSGNHGDIFLHLCWVVGYAAVFCIAAALLFVRQMKK